MTFVISRREKKKEISHLENQRKAASSTILRGIIIVKQYWIKYGRCSLEATLGFSTITLLTRILSYM